MSDSVASALAGAGGGIASMALTYPLITMSTRSQVSKTERMTQLETAKKIISEEGIAGLYSYLLLYL
jgi:adenine nucleotide transporter 17